jgi:hypothetical protein
MTTRTFQDTEHTRFGNLEEFCDIFYDTSANALIIQAPTSGTDNAPVDRISVNAGGTMVIPVAGTGLVDILRNDTAVTASLRVEQDSTGDPVLEFLLTGGAEWSMGVDNSAADIFVISAGGDLGTSDEDAIHITDASPPVLTWNAVHPTATFDYVCETCGDHGTNPFECHDAIAPWHDDAGALNLALQELSPDRQLHEIPEMQHLAKIGVLEMTKYEDGHTWTGMNAAASFWFTWSAMSQMWRRMQVLEAKLA